MKIITVAIAQGAEQGLDKTLDNDRKKRYHDSMKKKEVNKMLKKWKKNTRKLTDQNIGEIAALRYAGWTLKEISEKYGVSKQRIHQVCMKFYKGGS